MIVTIKIRQVQTYNNWSDYNASKDKNFKWKIERSFFWESVLLSSSDKPNWAKTAPLSPQNRVVKETVSDECRKIYFKSLSYPSLNRTWTPPHVFFEKYMHEEEIGRFDT